jgi:DNA adenine methylase
MIGPIPYIGGKNRLATKIIGLLPEHTTYVEAFCGGAQVFFHKQPSDVEVLNDLDHEVVNFLRVCQWHHEELIRFMKYMVVSRRWFEIVAKIDSELLTDVQRAGRFLYLQKNAFGGLVLNQRFHYGVVQHSNFNPERIPQLIEQTHRRLQHVQLECLPYERVLTKYDRPTTLFYLDPPYWGPKLYKSNFTEADFRSLAERLRPIRGKFVLSLNDRPEVRETFAGFQVQTVELSYTARRATSRQFREVLITNFSLPQAAAAA